MKASSAVRLQATLHDFNFGSPSMTRSRSVLGSKCRRGLGRSRRRPGRRHRGRQRRDHPRQVGQSECFQDTTALVSRRFLLLSAVSVLQSLQPCRRAASIPSGCLCCFWTAAECDAHLVNAGVCGGACRAAGAARSSAAGAPPEVSYTDRVRALCVLLGVGATRNGSSHIIFDTQLSGCCPATVAGRCCI